MKHSDTVTATDITNWVYCPESFRLAALGQKSANQAVQRSGTAHHASKATAERVASGSIAIGHFLIIVALLALIVWALLR